MNKNIETFIGCNSEYNDAKIVMFGAPFDSTTSFRPGARFGSSAIRHESFGIETYSPYQDKDLEDTNIFDCGDLELCFGSAEKALEDIDRELKCLSQNGFKEIVFVGINLSDYGKGTEHSLPDALALAEKYDEIKRVRLGSLEPDHITDEMIERLGKISKLCPQFHISVFFFHKYLQSIFIISQITNIMQ